MYGDVWFRVMAWIVRFDRTSLVKGYHENRWLILNGLALLRPFRVDIEKSHSFHRVPRIRPETSFSTNRKTSGGFQQIQRVQSDHEKSVRRIGGFRDSAA